MADEKNDAATNSEFPDNVLDFVEIRHALEAEFSKEIKDKADNVAFSLWKALSTLLDETEKPMVAIWVMDFVLTELADKLKATDDGRGNNTAASVLSVLESKIGRFREERDLPFLGPRGRIAPTMLD